MHDPAADLPADTRMNLIKFCCTMAWADFEVHKGEREYIRDLVTRLELPESDRAITMQWLKAPPPLDDLDPQIIPKAQRQLFMDECRNVIEADGELKEDEVETLELLRQILFPGK